jgi:hypothetical protein
MLDPSQDMDFSMRFVGAIVLTFCPSVLFSQPASAEKRVISWQLPCVPKCSEQVFATNLP